MWNTALIMAKSPYLKWSNLTTFINSIKKGAMLSTAPYIIYLSKSLILQSLVLQIFYPKYL